MRSCSCAAGASTITTGDVQEPPFADVRIAGSRIVAVAAGLAPLPGETVIDERGKLVIPGFVNAHYHSHDVLSKGLVEQLPLEIWALVSRIGDARNRREEVRTRTLIGAWECLRNGVTTLQDMNNQFPLDEDFVDVVLQAYADIGIRVVFLRRLRSEQRAFDTVSLRDDAARCSDSRARPARMKPQGRCV